VIILTKPHLSRRIFVVAIAVVIGFSVFRLRQRQPLR
jgi:hypothetical protein